MYYIDVYFRKSELRTVQEGYYKITKKVDAEIRDKILSNNSSEELVNNIFYLNNSYEIIESLKPIKKAIDRTYARNGYVKEYEIERLFVEWYADPYSISPYYSESIRLDTPKSGVIIGVIFFVIFIIGFFKKWKTIYKTFGLLFLLAFGWGLINYYIREPKLIEEAKEVIDEHSIRNDRFMRASQKKYIYLYSYEIMKDNN